MKLDAHCAVDDGFDVKLIEADKELGQPDVTQIPAMLNLHVFNWKCQACGHETYQGPTLTECAQCHATAGHECVMVWEPRRRKPRMNGVEGSGGLVRTEWWRFDSDLHFQYWNEYKKRPEASASDLAEVMTAIGCCWFMRRARFWELGGFDENAGIWGQYGVECALKSWLSGGRHLVNKRTWIAHAFRTQGGDWSFPYQLPATVVEQARKHSQSLWFGNAWNKQVHPLSWVLEKFAPVPGWHVASKEETRAEEPRRAAMAQARQARLRDVMQAGAEFLARRAA